MWFWFLRMWCRFLVVSFCFCSSAKPEGEGKSAAAQHFSRWPFVCFTLSHSDMIIALTFSLLLTYHVDRPTCARTPERVQPACLDSSFMHFNFQQDALLILFIYASMLCKVYLQTFSFIPRGAFRKCSTSHSEISWVWVYSALLE